MIGKTVKLQGTLGVNDLRMNKICIVDVQGDWCRDHCWTHHDKRFNGMQRGDRVQFTARLYEYVGVDDKGVQHKKIGLQNIRNVKRIER